MARFCVRPPTSLPACCSGQTRRASSTPTRPGTTTWRLTCWTRSSWSPIRGRSGCWTLCASVAGPAGSGRSERYCAVMLFPTSLVGSYPQPDWLIDRDRLAGRFPPRVRASELWRVDPAWLEQAQRDATTLAIHAQEQAGLDVITDGEQC